MEYIYGYGEYFKIIFYILVSMAFVTGVILMVSPNTFEALNKVLRKEFGLRKKFFPKLEDEKIEVIDQECA